MNAPSLIKLENLVVLQYASNNCYVRVVDLTQASIGSSSVSVDLQKSVWNYREWKDKRIGEARFLHSHENRFGVIGVYDKTNTTHLSSMVDSAIDAVRSRSSPLDD